jgi:hypothetical protein
VCGEGEEERRKVIGRDITMIVFVCVCVILFTVFERKL